jgi:hypothetical protein
MIKVLKTILLSAALVGFLSGWTLAQTAKPEHPTEHPKAGEVKKEAAKPEHPQADVKKPEHPKAEEKKPEHPKAGEKKPEHPK